MINGGKIILPTLQKGKNNDLNLKRVISEETSIELKKILRKVVTDTKGTASLADVYGYNVSGKTGTSQYYNDKNNSMGASYMVLFTYNGMQSKRRQIWRN